MGTRLLVDKNSGIKDFDDLKGKNVAVTAGTTSEKLLNKMNDEKKLGIHIISVKDHGDAFRTVESGRAVAFFIDDALLAGERAKAKNPAQWAIVGTPQSYEAYGCMMRKGDAPFQETGGRRHCRNAAFRRGGKVLSALVHAAHPAQGDEHEL